MMTKKQIKARDKKHAAMRKAGKKMRKEILGKIREYLSAGILITHSSCGGGFEEHYFTGMVDGRRMYGLPSNDTLTLKEYDCELAQYQPGDAKHMLEEIGIANITHIGRIAVDALEFAGHSLKPSQKTDGIPF